eukprot:g79542.t1
MRVLLGALLMRCHKLHLPENGQRAFSDGIGPTRVRILCLHGHAQNADKFRLMTDRMRATLAQQQVEMQYLDGTYTVPAPFQPFHAVTANTQPTALKIRSWWRYKGKPGADGMIQYEYDGWQESALKVSATFAKLKCNALMGFSQGGAMVALLTALTHSTIPPSEELLQKLQLPMNDYATLQANLASLRYVVSAGAFIPRAHDLQPLFRDRGIKPSVPSLHVCGESDKQLLPRDSKKLSKLFAIQTPVRNTPPSSPPKRMRPWLGSDWYGPETSCEKPESALFSWLTNAVDTTTGEYEHRGKGLVTLPRKGMAKQPRGKGVKDVFVVSALSCLYVILYFVPTTYPV